MDLKDVAVFAVAVIIGVVSWISDNRKRKEGRHDSGKEPLRRADIPVNPIFEKIFSSISEQKAPEASAPVKEVARVSKKPAKTAVDAVIAAPKPPVPQTAATTPVPPPETEHKRVGLKPLDRDNLRNAIIWGEILQRKF